MCMPLKAMFVVNVDILSNPFLSDFDVFSPVIFWFYDTRDNREVAFDYIFIFLQALTISFMTEQVAGFDDMYAKTSLYINHAPILFQHFLMVTFLLYIFSENFYIIIHL
ncbi:hypothetical protein ACJX0J_027632 [Zea mays]